MKKAVQNLRTTFKWKDNSRVKVDAAVAAEALQQIKDRAKVKGQRFSRTQVVEAARAKRHPLHNEFEWDDTKAAHAHRLERARYLIRSVVVTVAKIDSKGKVLTSNTLRQFTSLGVGAEDGKDSEFHDTRELLSDAELRKQVLTKIWRQLLNLKRQYEDYQEFAEVWTAVDAAEKTMVANTG